MFRHTIEIKSFQKINGCVLLSIRLRVGTQKQWQLLGEAIGMHRVDKDYDREGLACYIASFYPCCDLDECDKIEGLVHKIVRVLHESHDEKDRDAGPYRAG